MLINEAQWLRDQFARQATLSPMLSVGSSTETFRTVDQPHIERDVVAPLRARGVEIVNLDLKDAPGVDLVGDITDPEFRGALRARQWGSVLCSNLLEHVLDPKPICEGIVEVLSCGGLAFITGPRRYPHHSDPIDTMFRPGPDELAGFFPGMTPITAEEVADRRYGSYWWQYGSLHGMRHNMAVSLVTGLHRPGKRGADVMALWSRTSATCLVLQKDLGAAPLE